MRAFVAKYIIYNWKHGNGFLRSLFDLIYVLHLSVYAKFLVISVYFKLKVVIYLTDSIAYA